MHGWASDASTWTHYRGASGYLANAHPYWEGFAVGDGRGTLEKMNTGDFLPSTIPNSIEKNAEIMGRYVEAVRSQENAWNVDIVGHSMGG